MNRLLVSASVFALIGGTAAHAQDTVPAPAKAEASGEVNGASSKNAGDDIVVTAERRTVSLQRAPIAATVLSGAELSARGVTSVDQLQQVSPSLTVQNRGQGNSFNIRGIGKAETSTSTGVGVITYRDGVATFPGFFQWEPYYDISSVEILRGPQGTFAGQNATGGAVFITETNPGFDGVNGYVQADYGNYADKHFQGAVNLPVSDTLAIRFATNLEHRDSFYTITGPLNQEAGYKHSYSGRASILWQPVTGLRILLKGDYTNIDLGGYPADPVLSTGDRFVIGANAPLAARDEFARIVLNVSYTTPGGLVLRSIGGFQKGTSQVRSDPDGTAGGTGSFYDKVNERVWSQEFNIVSPDTGPFTWVAGAYYQSDKLIFPPGQFITSQPPLEQRLQGVNPKTTLAGFGQVGYQITPTLQIQAGTRYSRSTSRNNASFEILPFGIVVPFNDFVSDKKLTGKIALNWRVTPNQFVYAFVATGHKASGLNTPSLSGLAPLPFKPEDVTDYELGWKGTWLGGRLRTQLGGYYNRFTGFQVAIGDPRVPTQSSILNVPNPTHLYGVEFSAQGQFGGFSVTVGGAVSNSRIGRFFAQDPRLPRTGTCDRSAGPATSDCLDLSGNAQTYAPHFTGNIGAEYKIALGGGWSLTPRFDYAHIGGSWASLFQNTALGDRLPVRDIVNAQLTLASGDWSIQAYSSNLFNEQYTAAVNAGLRFSGPPRQYGLRVTKTF